MNGNRYRDALLTIIAIELGWLALTHAGVPVSAQQTAATRVVITGVDLPRDQTLPVVMRGVDLANRDAFLPVAVLGQTSGPQDPRFEPLDVRTTAPVKIEADRPLRIQEPVTVRIPVTTSPRPGL